MSLIIALLHFALPLSVSYAVFANSRLSRPLIGLYSAILYSATMLGNGVLGNLPAPEVIRESVATFVLIVIMGWLYRSPKMRLYYCLLSGTPVPADLESRAPKLLATSKFELCLHRTLNWVADHLETVVLLGFIIVVLIAFLGTTTMNGNLIHCFQHLTRQVPTIETLVAIVESTPDDDDVV